MSFKSIGAPLLLNSNGERGVSERVMGGLPGVHGSSVIHELLLL